MWLSRPGHSPSPLEPTGQVRSSQTTSHYLQKAVSAAIESPEQHVAHGMAVTVTCRVWPGLCPTDNETQGTTEISSRDRAPMPILQAGRELLDKHMSSCVNLCRASSCRPQVHARFGTRACACCCICVLSVSRGLEPNKAKSAITTHHPVCGIQQIRFALVSHQQTNSPPQRQPAFSCRATARCQ